MRHWDDREPGPTNPLHYVCPKCGAAQSKKCRTTSGSNRATDTHEARYDLVGQYQRDSRERMLDVLRGA